MPLFEYKGIKPRVHPEAWVAPTATLIGDVEVGKGSSIWFGAVLRGDVMPIRIGAHTSIQDNSVVHSTGGWSTTEVGDHCTVGHNVVLHGCRVGNTVLVGMGAVVLDAAEIGDGCLIGASSLVTARTVIESGMLVLGQPARAKRELTDAERDQLLEGPKEYARLMADYRA